MIRDVARGGAAARAGLRGLQADRFGSVILGDVIIGIDDREIHTFDDMYQALDRRHAGDHVRVRVRNERRERAVDLVLQELD